ncbi:RpoE-regulated lipoprotein [Proteus myxofaciens]|uniref:Putative outer membrane lipoprotein n=1 Tax=Proteus myxofaciens ATCC 19692 TaxID=1354337 RepID=A0A198GEC2_9GAMM|nr:RpoE-regulated lipoprotein [Proteus myxofaciens]OAT35144.1 putative outer membrane lipoprotein [Proteus myxofaciens ATCC 19692]
MMPKFWLPLCLSASVLLLSGCSSMGGMSFSALNPMNWFSSEPLAISADGLGNINSSTKISEDDIKNELGSHYHYRQGMEMQNGDVVVTVQALEDNKVQVAFYGKEKGNVEKIAVSDVNATTSWGTKVGMPFKDIYKKAFGACTKGPKAEDKKTILCQSQQAKSVSYVFSGRWDGPDGLMPPDEALSNWSLTQIVWQNK